MGWQTRGRERARKRGWGGHSGTPSGGRTKRMRGRLERRIGTRNEKKRREKKRISGGRLRKLLGEHSRQTPPVALSADEDGWRFYSRGRENARALSWYETAVRVSENPLEGNGIANVKTETVRTNDTDKERENVERGSLTVWCGGANER